MKNLILTPALLARLTQTEGEYLTREQQLKRLEALHLQAKLHRPNPRD